MQQRNNSNKLGNFIRETREHKGLSAPKLAEAVGVHHSAIVRIQHGEIRQPRPALLAKIAEALGVSAADLYALAGYRSEDEMPDLKGWLNVKHRGLPESAHLELQGHLDYLLDKYARETNNDAKDTTKPKGGSPREHP